jgi:hypothetical protein
LGVAGTILALAASLSAAAQPKGCQKVVLEGEATAGQEWRAAFGEGWVFRVLPIAPGKAGYSGWDLVVDREEPAGFPDALLVATPPYDSINEREVGTTFGLRAQDAIGWNPRSFRFLRNAAAFKESQKVYRALIQAGRSKSGTAAAQRLMELERQSAAGEFRILDARLAPGISDAAPYAEHWALALPRTAHSFEAASAGKSTPLGELHWMRFSITLWLPGSWKAPKEVHVTPAGCME